MPLALKKDLFPVGSSGFAGSGIDDGRDPASVSEDEAHAIKALNFAGSRCAGSTVARLIRRQSF
ncbi:hypothetical protein FRUB_03861 [Fimbriiglobus ruber]|uniref:Uncharacterized protein n=1 Tax=Fimbriiglobus ruber TaxID=1908690 RepID=A0A225DLB9_9BACT|nr:hypothetical protein FRUB_03861 [Fimbriiglobus ruber]